MKYILTILCGAFAFISCNPQAKYEKRATEFLETIPQENIVATRVDKKIHCIFYLSKEIWAIRDENEMYWDCDSDTLYYMELMKYDLKAQKTSAVVSNKLKDIRSFRTNGTYIFVHASEDHAYYYDLYLIDKDKWIDLDEKISATVYPVVTTATFTGKGIRLSTNIDTGTNDSSYSHADPLILVYQFDENGEVVQHYIYNKRTHEKYN
ncbi:MAG: hypothetical protein NC250_06560 [Alistipes senegalensis]|nr:hypothetical protein [Alistipes senegalensis]